MALVLYTSSRSKCFTFVLLASRAAALVPFEVVPVYSTVR